MRKPRILIADDDTMVRIGLKTVINWEENGGGGERTGGDAARTGKEAGHRHY